jgi:hypothetical protein
MTMNIQLQIAQAILATGLVPTVYHSCELVRNLETGRTFPGYKVGADYMYVGNDDTQAMYAYIRSNGDAPSVPLKLTSCARQYEISTPLRVVFYHDVEDRDQHYLQTKLATFTFLTNVTLQRIIVDKFRLAKEENTINDPKFDGKVFYLAFDIIVKTVLLPDDCAADACEIFPNPICKP